MNNFRLYFRYLGLSVRSQMECRASFVMLVLGHFVATGSEVLGIWVLFARFKSLAGWRLEEIALFYGLIGVAFAIAEGSGRGFDVFDWMVRAGDFDRLLLRPRSTVLQVAAQELSRMRLGRFTQALIVLLWAANALTVQWSLPKIGLALFAILGGACLFYGLFVLQATLCFWTTESLELMNTVTYGGTEIGQYPLSLYRPWFRRFFAYVVPLACVSYFPVLALLGRDDPVVGSPEWFRWVAPLTGVLFLTVCLQVWQVGVRHYRSTGS